MEQKHGSGLFFFSSRCELRTVVRYAMSRLAGENVTEMCCACDVQECFVSVRKGRAGEECAL